MKLTLIVLLLFVSIGIYAQTPVATFEAGKTKNTLSPSESTGDGNYIHTKFDGKDAIKNINYRNYLYFIVDSEIRKNLGDDLWLLVEGGSDILGWVQVKYNSKEDNYAYAEEIRTLGSNEVDKFLIHLPNANFRGSQNYGSDFRIETNFFNVNKISLYNEKPNLKQKTQAERENYIIKFIENLPKVSTKNNFGLVVGDNPFDFINPERRGYRPFGYSCDYLTAQYLKALGVTSMQTEITWEMCELKDNMWDWNLIDDSYKILEDVKIKISPFIVVGPAYSVPAWFRETENHVPAKCLEHGIAAKTESVWNPNFVSYIDRFLNELTKRHPDTEDTYEIITMGIQGDFGEALYPIVDTWSSVIPGPAHIHEGFWCNDPLALESYRNYMEKKYNNIDFLNKTWNTNYKSFEEMDFPARGDELIAYTASIPDADGFKRRQFLDFVTWYRGEMTNLAEKWFTTAKKYFPKAHLVLGTGGDGSPMHGSDFSLQCKLAAKYNGGVRITNEGPEYRWNNTGTRLVASAGRFYGCGTANEAAIDVPPTGVIARIYGAVSSGSNYLQEYCRNFTDTPENLENLKSNIKYMEYYPNVRIPLAIFYPNVDFTLAGKRMDVATQHGHGEVRYITDYDYVDENMLRDGALEKFDILVLFPSVMEPEDALKIKEWAENGGHIAVIGDKKFETVERTNESENILFPINQIDGKIGKGTIKRYFDYKELKSDINNYYKSKEYPTYDFSSINVFGSWVDKNTLLFYNGNPESASVKYNYNGKEGSFNITGNSIEKIIVQ